MRNTRESLINSSISPNHFQGKRVLITGGASGIGAMLGEILCKQGATVALADIHHENLESIAAKISSTGMQVQTYVLDVSDPLAFEQVIRAFVNNHQGIDYLFNMAGIAVGGLASAYPPEVWKTVTLTNLLGMIHGCIIASSYMAKQGSGHLINMSSFLALFPQGGAIPYSLSKAGIFHFSRALQTEVARHGISVSVVCPGVVQTPILHSTRIYGVPEGEMDNLLKFFPFKKMTAAVAAQKILRGVVRKKMIIIFPCYARLLWVADRLFPFLMGWVGRKSLDRMVSAGYGTATPGKDPLH